MNKIRVLAIAPYEAMKSQILNLAEEFEELEITTFVGDLEEGVVIAEANFHGNFDIVLSRGATAELLREKLSIPVVGVEISIYDIMLTIRLSDAAKKKAAVVSFADVRESVKQLEILMACTLDCNIIPKVEKTVEVLLACKEKGYKTVLCDMIADRYAKELGMDSFLITSSDNSIRNAFKEVIRTSKTIDNLRSENSLLRTLFLSQIGKTVVFDDKKHLYLSSAEEIDACILEMLKAEIDGEKERKLVWIRNGIIYSIRKKTIEMHERIYHAFFYTERKNAIQAEREGIEFLSTGEVSKKYYASLFFLAETMNLLGDKISKINKISSPVLIYGASGTGKQNLAQAIYLTGKLRNNPFIQIDCAQLNDKSWDFLMNSTTSPLSMLDQTIYFSDLNKLDKDRLPVLLAALKDIGEDSRIRIIFSSTSDDGPGDTASIFLDALSAVSIRTPELKEQKENIPSLFKKLLSTLNTAFPHGLLGIENNALGLLTQYPWPRNFTQFERITKDIILQSKTSIADISTVKSVLEKEEHTIFINTENETSFPLSLDKSLKEIEKDIAKKVLKEEKGNQSATAKRLSISRTTLWRMLSND